MLIGDSGEQDAEIYREAARAHPGRIRAIYIRDAQLEHRATAVRAIAEELRAGPTPLLLVSDTVAAAEHAAAHGLIQPDALPAIRADKVRDNPPAPRTFWRRLVRLSAERVWWNVGQRLRRGRGYRFRREAMTGGHQQLCRWPVFDSRDYSARSGASAPGRFGLELAQEALEEAAVALLVVQNLDDHVLRDPVHAVADLDDLVVVLDRPALRRDHALDDVDDVGLLGGRLQTASARA